MFPWTERFIMSTVRLYPIDISYWLVKAHCSRSINGIQWLVSLLHEIMAKQVTFQAFMTGVICKRGFTSQTHVYAEGDRIQLDFPWTCEHFGGTYSGKCFWQGSLMEKQFRIRECGLLKQVCGRRCVAYCYFSQNERNLRPDVKKDVMNS